MPAADDLGIRLLAFSRGGSAYPVAPGDGAPMIAGIIFACSVVFLLQFFVSYCRSLIAASSKQALSAEVRDVTGIAATASGEDFLRVMQLLQLCPESPEDRSRVQAVRAYFRLLNFVRSTFAKMVPSLRSWIERE